MRCLFRQMAERQRMRGTTVPTLSAVQWAPHRCPDHDEAKQQTSTASSCFTGPTDHIKNNVCLDFLNTALFLAFSYSLLLPLVVFLIVVVIIIVVLNVIVVV